MSSTSLTPHMHVFAAYPSVKLDQSTGTRREQAELERVLAYSATQQEQQLAPPAATVYPSLRGTLPNTSSASVNRTSSDEQVILPAYSSAAALAAAACSLPHPPAVGSSSSSALKTFTLVPNTISSTTDDISSFSATRRLPPHLPATTNNNTTSGSEIDSFGSSVQQAQQLATRMEALEGAVEQPQDYDYVLDDSEDERQGSARPEGLDSSAYRDGAAFVDPALIFPPPAASTATKSTYTSNEISTGSSKDIEVPAPAPPAAPIVTPAALDKARKPTSLGKQKDTFAIVIPSKAPGKSKERTKTKTKVKKAEEKTYKSAETIESSEDELGIQANKKASPRRGRSRSASVVSRAVSVPTDYDEQPPHVKARPAKRPRRSVDDDDDGSSRPSISTPTDIPTTSTRARSNSVASAASAGPAPRRTKSAPAISEDEDGLAEVARAVAEAEKKGEEDDSDFGGGSKGKKDKGKKKRKPSKEKASGEEKEKKRRVPRKKKDAYAAQQDAPMPTTTTITTEESVATSSRSQPTPALIAPEAQPIAAGNEDEQMDEEQPVVAPAAKGKAPKKTARLIVDSKDEEQPAPPAAPSVDSIKKSNRQRSQENGKSTSGKTKNKKRVIESEEEGEDEHEAQVEKRAPFKLVSEDEEEEHSPVKKSRKSSAKGKEKAVSPAIATPVPLAARGRRRSSATDRMAAVMAAAAQEPEQSLLCAPNARNKAGPSHDRQKEVYEEDEEEEDAVKENDVPQRAKPPAAVGTPVAAARPVFGSASRAGTPGLSKSTPKNPRSLAGVIERKGLPGYRPPGLSSRAKIPRLHTNLKPPPPPKAALPKEKERKKKGHESYSDEEKPWYETKHPEEWDDEDHDRWKKHLRRKELGLDSDE